MGFCQWQINCIWHNKYWNFAVGSEISNMKISTNSQCQEVQYLEIYKEFSLGNCYKKTDYTLLCDKLISVVFLLFFKSHSTSFSYRGDEKKRLLALMPFWCTKMLLVALKLMSEIMSNKCIQINDSLWCVMIGSSTTFFRGKWLVKCHVLKWQKNL